jgi:hypothetical protein
MPTSQPLVLETISNSSSTYYRRTFLRSLLKSFSRSLQLRFGEGYKETPSTKQYQWRTSYILTKP